MHPPLIRKQFTFYGAVQGVGFRWRARHAAQLYGCTGWARNEWDGSVTMEIQGTEESIQLVLAALERGAYIHIDRREERLVPAVEERDFRTE